MVTNIDCKNTTYGNLYDLKQHCIWLLQQYSLWWLTLVAITQLMETFMTCNNNFHDLQQHSIWYFTYLQQYSLW